MIGTGSFEISSFYFIFFRKLFQLKNNSHTNSLRLVILVNFDWIRFDSITSYFEHLFMTIFTTFIHDSVGCDFSLNVMFPSYWEYLADWHTPSFSNTQYGIPNHYSCSFCSKKVWYLKKVRNFSGWKMVIKWADRFKMVKNSNGSYERTDFERSWQIELKQIPFLWQKVLYSENINIKSTILSSTKQKTKKN